MKMTKKELRNKIEGVLYLAPFYDAGEVWLALLKKYPYSAIETIMEEIKEEKMIALRNLSSDIVIVDENDIPIEMVIKDGEKKKKEFKDQD